MVEANDVGFVTKIVKTTQELEKRKHRRILQPLSTSTAGLFPAARGYTSRSNFGIPPLLPTPHRYLWRNFSRAAARAHSTLRCTASLHGSPRVALLNFWTPMGLVLTSRALLFASVRLVSLCTTSPFPARAHSLSARSARCQSLPEYLLKIHESLSLFFSTLLTLYFRFLYLVRSPIPCSSNATSPKAFHTLAYSISVSLIVHPVCAPAPKRLHFLLYLTCSVKAFPIFNKASSSSNHTALCPVLSQLVCNRLGLLDLPLLIAFPCVDFLSPSFPSSCSHPESVNRAHLYLPHLQQRRRQYLARRSCGTSRRRAPHSCLLHSSVGVLHQAAPALGGVTSIQHLHLMARVMVRHKMHLRDRIL